MKFENTQVFNFEGAFRGMRNPLESWHHSDSFFGIINPDYDFPETDISDGWIEKENDERIEQGKEPWSADAENYSDYYDILDKYDKWLQNRGILRQDNFLCDVAYLGPNDLGLAQKLIAAGPEHCKFLRQIFVSVDITAPIYWWKEFDTYKVGTTANSTSTMHKLTSKAIDMDCFETDDYDGNYAVPEYLESYNTYPGQFLHYLEDLRTKYLETGDKGYWKELIRWLPESWLQKRTVTMSYANLRNIFFQRNNHKLTEWHTFCDWIETLPWGEELIMYN